MICSGIPLTICFGSIDKLLRNHSKIRFQIHQWFASEFFEDLVRTSRRFTSESLDELLRNLSTICFNIPEGFLSESLEDSFRNSWSINSEFLDDISSTICLGIHRQIASESFDDLLLRTWNIAYELPRTCTLEFLEDFRRKFWIIPVEIWIWNPRNIASDSLVGCLQNLWRFSSVCLEDSRRNPWSNVALFLFSFEIDRIFIKYANISTAYRT